MSDRPSWFTSQRRRIRRAIFRRFILPLVNSEMRRSGVHLYLYDESTARLWWNDKLGWSVLTRPAGSAVYPEPWYAPLRDRGIRCPVIFDVGCAGGGTSVWFSLWAERVFAFEPSPTNRELIRVQHKIRSIQNVEVIPVALSDHCGEATLHHKRSRGHHALSEVGASATVERIPVTVTTLDTFAEERSIERAGLLKIDVEGFEPEVIRGADRLLRERRIDLVLFEFSPHFYSERGLPALATIDELEKRAYRVFHLDGSPIDREALKQSRQTDLLAEPGNG